jgi:hypothetical protein
MEMGNPTGREIQEQVIWSLESLALGMVARMRLAATEMGTETMTVTETATETMTETIPVPLVPVTRAAQAIRVRATLTLEISLDARRVD